MKPKIFFQESWRCYNKLDMIHLTKKCPKMLHKISISPIIANKYDFDKTQRLCQSLKNIKSLHSLHLKLSKCNQESLELIALYLKSLNRLQNLSLDFSGCNRVLPEGLTALFASLKKSIYLTSLNLNFNQSSLGMKLITQLTSLALKNQRNLRYLEISFQTMNQIMFTEMRNFIKSLKRCAKTLESLSLDFSKCRDFCAQAIHCVLLGLKSFKALVHLNLNLKKSKVLDPLPENKLLESYPVKKTLTHLQLNLDFYNSANLYDFELLMLQLKDYKALETLDISFPVEAHKILRIFTSNIKGMKSLKKLKVSFNSLDESLVNNELMPEFALAFKELEHLRTLDMKFSGFNIKTQTMNKILEGIRRLENLRSFTINLSLSSGINNKSAENLGMCLRGLRELVYLNVELANCGLTNTGVAAIWKGLENLKKLKYVKLDPNNPIVPQGSWFKDLFRRKRDIMPVGAEFHEISDLTLNFFGFELSVNELNNIALNLQKMKKISQISLSFDCLNSDEKWRTGLSRIITVLHESPNLFSFSLGLHQFGNEDLESLFIDIEGMGRLRSLSIFLHKGEVFDDYTAMKFWEAMRSLWKLKEFQFQFHWHNSFKAESVRYLLLGLWELRCAESLIFDLKLSIDYLAIQGYAEVEDIERRVLKKLKSLRTLRFLRYMDETIIS